MCSFSQTLQKCAQLLACIQRVVRFAPRERRRPRLQIHGELQPDLPFLALQLLFRQIFRRRGRTGIDYRK